MDFDVFRARLKQLIVSNGLTTITFAEKVGVSAPTIFRYLSGDRVPELPKVMAIAQYFNVSMDWLLGMNGNKFSVYSDDVQSVIDRYSIASESDKLVIDTILKKYE